jgi:hypothetical protein
MTALKISGLGAEPKKLVVLGGLVLVAAYFLISNMTSSSSPGGEHVATNAPAVSPQRIPGRPVSRQRPGQRSASSSLKEFRPSLTPNKDEAIDPSAIDPTLHLDLLEKLQNVKVEGGARSLFEYMAGPPPAEMAAAKIPEPAKIKVSQFIGPKPPPPPPPPAPEPPPPPIPLKFYGFVNRSKPNDKRAFFLDGEDIIVASEGELIKKRYKIVRIGVNSAVVEDTQFKNHQQTLPLVQEQS